MDRQARKVRSTDLRGMKQRGERIAMLTAYDSAMARILDREGVDVLLVGDSLGMVMLGHETTVPVTMEMMLHHTKAVTRVSKRSLVVTDMPFLSYQITEEDALRNAGRMIQEGGAEGIKIEGGRWLKQLVSRLVEIGIPVMGHLGLTPQSVHQLGGFRFQALEQDAAERLIEDAKILEDAGIFALVLECIPSAVAQAVTEQVHVPTIGIGAGPHCDGQVLVIHDMLGMLEGAPSFVKQYADVGEIIAQAAKGYIRDVREGLFPEERTIRKANR